MSKIVHFEIPVDDPDRASAFYSDVLGWTVSRWGEEPYWLVTAGGEDEPGANGALIARGGNHTQPVVVAGVVDVDATLAAAQAHGATVVQEKLPVPGMGWSAYLRDPEGNVVGVFQIDAQAGG